MRSPSELYELLDHDLDQKVRATSPTIGIFAMVSLTLLFATSLSLVFFGIIP